MGSNEVALPITLPIQCPCVEWGRGMGCLTLEWEEMGCTSHFPLISAGMVLAAAALQVMLRPLKQPAVCATDDRECTLNALLNLFRG